MAKSAPRDRRIRWNDDEKSILIAEGRKVMAKTPMKPLEALAAAQRVLPSARRRQVATAAKVRWFLLGVGAAHAGARAGAAPASTLATPAAPASDAVAVLKRSLVTFFAEVFEEALDTVRARSRAAGGATRGATVSRRGKAPAPARR